MPAPRILVVEDERIIAFHLRQQLTKLGYDVPSTVSTGGHALRRIEEMRPDLVLMDINLRGKLDGIATAAAIPPAYRIPVIYLTAHSEDATLARAVATNPHGYLLKPFSERELHAMIQVTLARCRSERASRTGLERRQQARKMEALNQLASGMADEVNDLLTVLYGQLEVLGGHAIGDPALAEPIQDTFSEAIEKERLIQRLLDFSGRRKLMPATVSVNDLVTNVTSQLKHILGDTIQVRPRLPDDLWKARIDAAQLTRALANLAVNAREAMPNGGTLTIEGQNAVLDQDDAEGRGDAGRYVLLTVADTGIGMPERVVERAFEPFFTTKPAGGGSGLGLSLVFGFVRQSGGHISIDSKPGSGTTVRIYLPAAPDDAVSIAPSAPDDRDFLAQTGPAEDGVTIGRRDIVSKTATAIPRHRGDDRVSHLLFAAAREDSEPPVLWHKAETALFASVLIPPGEVRYRLIVEPLPRRDGWDWTVWRPGDTEETSRYGRASSVVSAMAAAEDTARHWNKTEAPGS
jgi:signal transduction histidine kinase